MPLFSLCAVSSKHISILLDRFWIVSKPSVPFLVGQIVRQQDFRCPFLVISGGNECYYNPLSLSFPRSLPLNHLCSLALKFYTTLFCAFVYSSFSCSPASISSSVYSCCSLFPLFAMAFLVVWHSVRVIGLSAMMCKESISPSKTHWIVRLWYIIRDYVVRELRLASG